MVNVLMLCAAFKAPFGLKLWENLSSFFIRKLSQVAHLKASGKILLLLYGF